MLLMHIIFGLAVYPVAMTCYIIQDRLTFHISSGFMQNILFISIVYWGFRVGLVLLWFYLGFELSGFVGLRLDSEEISTASDELVMIYLLVWTVTVIVLAIKAHWKAERLAYEIQKKLNEEDASNK